MLLARVCNIMTKGSPGVRSPYGKMSMTLHVSSESLVCQIDRCLIEFQAPSRCLVMGRSGKKCSQRRLVIELVIKSSRGDQRLNCAQLPPASTYSDLYTV